MDALLQKLDELILEVRQLYAQTEPVKEIMSVSQAAEYLGQSEYTIREWVRLRRVPHSKVNGTIKFRRSKLICWIDRGEIPTIE